MELKLNSNSGFAIRIRWIEARGERLEGLRRNKGAQKSFFTGRLPAGSVPLKGETKSKRAGRMPALQRRKLKGNCADQRPVFLVFGFDFLLFSTPHTPGQASHTSR
jgi:hypothetical protein